MSKAAASNRKPARLTPAKARLAAEIREQLKAQGGAALESLDAQIEVTRLVHLAGQEAVLGFAEADGVGKLGLADLAARAKIEKHAFALLDGLDFEGLAFVGLDRVPLLEAHAAQGRGFDGVLAVLVGGGEVDFHPAEFGLHHHAKAELWLAVADPALSGKGLFHC